MDSSSSRSNHDDNDSSSSENPFGDNNDNIDTVEVSLNDLKHSILGRSVRTEENKDGDDRWRPRCSAARRKKCGGMNNRHWTPTLDESTTFVSVNRNHSLLVDSLASSTISWRLVPTLFTFDVVVERYVPTWPLDTTQSSSIGKGKHAIWKVICFGIAIKRLQTLRVWRAESFQCQLKRKIVDEGIYWFHWMV